MKKLRLYFNNIINRKGVRELVKFALVGSTSTVIDFIILNICIKFLTLTIPFATFWGFIFGTINGYLLNNRWTFGDRNKSANSRDLIKYTIISAVGLGLTELIMHQLAVKSDLHYNLAKLIAVFIVFFWNFFINRAWTFKKKS